MKINFKKLNLKVLIFLGIFILVVLSGVVYVVAEGVWDTGWRVNNGTMRDITIAGGACQKITNSSGKDLFIPTKTAAEWNAFSARAGALGVTISSCCVAYQGQFCGGNECVNAGTYDCAGSCVGQSNKSYGTACSGTHNMCDGSGNCVPDCRDKAADYFIFRPDVLNYCNTEYCSDANLNAYWGGVGNKPTCMQTCGLWHWCVHGHNLDQRYSYPCRCYHDYDCSNRGFSYYSAYCP